MAFNSFGSSNTFGAAANKPAFGFGAPAAGANSGFAFGSKPTSSGFGATNNAGGFGMSSTLGGGSAFGATNNNNVFGSPSTGNAFGKSFSTNTSVTNNLGGLGGNTSGFGLGSSPGGAFGAAANAFGSRPAGTTSPSTPFGGGNAFGASNTLGGGSAFGGGGGAFGANTNAGGAFGSSAFGSSAPAFGASATPAFGAPATTSAFGAPATSAFGAPAASAFGTGAPAFGSNTTSAFGGGGAFGNTATTQPASGGFGAFGSTGSTFGQPAGQTSAFGAGAFGGATNTAFGQPAAGGAGGTGNPKFSPHPIQENVSKAGHNQVTTLSLQVITGMTAYNTKSMEELRFEDYQKGNKSGNAVGGLGGGFGLGAGAATPFGQPTATGGAFGSGAFGAAAAPATNTFSFGGAAPAAANPFGAPATTSAFGSTPAFGASTTPAFGSTAPAFGSAAPAFGAAAPAFGSTATPAFGSAAPAFGAPAATSAFGSTGGAFGSSAPAFGSTATPAFGAAPATTSAFGSFGAPAATTSAFGAPAAASTGFGGFGAAAAPAFGAPATTSAFGAAPAAGGVSFGGFGSTAAPASAGGMFGAPAANATPSFSFGAAAAPAATATPSFSFGGLGSATGATTGAFGAAPATTSAFGAPAASGFGGFGSTTGASAFGASPATSTFGATTATSAMTPAQNQMIQQQLVQQYIASQQQFHDIALKIDMMRNKKDTLMVNPNDPVVISSNSTTDSPVRSAFGSLKNRLRPESPPSERVYPRGWNSDVPTATPSKPVIFTPATPISENALKVLGTPNGIRVGRSVTKLQLSVYSNGAPMDPTDDLPPPQYFNRNNNISNSVPSSTSKTPMNIAETPARTPSALSSSTVRSKGEATGLTPFHSSATPLAVSASKFDNDENHNGNDSILRPSRHIAFDLSSPTKDQPDNSSAAPPKLTKTGYFTSPDMSVLSRMTDAELKRVNSFTVFRPNFGRIEWKGETDVRDLDLDAIVRIDKKEVFVYENMNTPMLGSGLNKDAIVTLYNVFPKEGADEEKQQAFAKKLREFCRLNDAEFNSYDLSSGEWIFTVKHFSRYGLDEDFEEKTAIPSRISSDPQSSTERSETDGSNTPVNDAKPSKESGKESRVPQSIHQALMKNEHIHSNNNSNPSSGRRSADSSNPNSSRKSSDGQSNPSSARKSGDLSSITYGEELVTAPPSGAMASSSGGPTFDPYNIDSYSISMSAIDFYSQFWERTFTLFYEVCDPYKNCDECLCIIEDLAIFVRQSCGQVSSPVVALALDVVVQRAMYELSDKTTKRTDGSTSQCSVQNIEHCIAIMTQVISPLINKLADTIKPPFPLNDKVATLTRQLQELIAWSSFHSQVIVPDSFPKYNVDASNEVEDATKLHNYPPPNNPSNSSYSNPTVRVLDDTICNLVREISTANVIPGDLVHNIQGRLHKILNTNFGVNPGRGNPSMTEIGINPCGSVALGLMDAESKKEIDFVTYSSPFNFNFHNYPLETRKGEMRTHQALQAEAQSIEKIVGGELLADAALKHFRACLKDFRNLSSEFVNKMSDFAANSGPGSASHYDADVYHRMNGGMGGGYNNSFEFPYANNSFQGMIQSIRSNVETMRSLSDALVERYVAMKDAAIRQNPNITVLTKRLEAIQMQLDYKENERFSAIRRAMTTIEKQLKESGYNYVRVITHKTRFMHLKFIYQEFGMDVIPCNLIVHNVLPLQTSDLLNAYMTIDKSGKIRDFIHVVKLFAKSHRISDPTSGFLSSTAWHVMAIHVLLHFEYLPNLHMDKIYRTDSEASGVNNYSPPNTHRSMDGAGGYRYQESELQEVAFATPRSMYLAAKYVTKIEDTSIIEMLDVFFRYYVEQVDCFRDVISLKDKGQVLKKTDWSKTNSNAVLWRLSIEDPFDHAASQHPYDLGSTLSRPGQLTTFKALRRAIYGIHSIVSVGVDACYLNVKKFFSRSDLITLARKSDYLGAVITDTPTWSSANAGPQRSPVRSTPYGNVSSDIDMAALAMNQANTYKTQPSHGVPKLALNFQGGAPHESYSARSGYESLSARSAAMQHPGAHYQSNVNTGRSMYSARDPYLMSPRGGELNESGLYHHQLQHQQHHGAYAQEGWHHGQSAPNSARYSQASIDTYDEYSDVEYSPRRYGGPPGYAPQMIGGNPNNSRALPVKTTYTPRLPLNNMPNPPQDPRYGGGNAILSPRRDDYSRSQPTSARMPPAPPVQLRSDAAVFLPQNFGNPATSPTKKPVVPLIQLSQLQFGGGNPAFNTATSNSNLQSDRFLDLSAMPRTSPGRYPEGYTGSGEQTPRMTHGQGPINETAELQEIMEKMSSDALNISQTITSARSTVSSATNANSATTTLDRFSIASNSTLTPRGGQGMEYSEYRPFVVPQATHNPAVHPNNKSVSPYASQHLTPRGV